MANETEDQDYLKALLDLHDQPVVLIDDQYTIVAANNAYARSYAQPNDTLVGEKCHRVSHRSNVPCHERGEDCPVKRVMQTGKPVNTLHIHFNGDAEPERVRVQGFPIEHNGRRLLAEKIQRIDPQPRPAKAEQPSELMVGQSPAFLTLLNRLIQVSGMPGSTLLEGESGVGKELAARFVHEHSAHASGPLVVADCATIPNTLFEAELFGHEKGAFTGSGPARQGLFETAAGGTLFLDEIGELPLELQSKLLRAIDTGEIRRLGSREPKTVNVRIVAATNRDLQAMVAQGSFRLDLYYRLATHEVRVPPLRERRDDLKVLCEALLNRMDMASRPTIQDEAIAVIKEQELPGNVRELRNLLERALTFGFDIGPAAIKAALNSHQREAGVSAFTLSPLISDAARQDAEADVIHDVSSNRALLLAKSLRRFNGNRAQAAADLGISERTVYRWMKHFCNDPNCNW